ncbi:MAG: DUF934 domain-containing protein [Pseudomonadota bacterium]
MLVDRSGAVEDAWTHADDNGPLPAGPVILPRARLSEAAGRAGPTGVHLPNDTDPRDIVPVFGDLDLISVAFPSFADGRGFSIGKMLRELGFEGRLRATGPVISDQFAYLLECGFDEAAVPEAVAARQPVEMWLAQLSTLSIGYQRGVLCAEGRTGAGRASILDRRRAAGR